MTSKFALAIFFLGFCVTIGSFADEATQIIFALRLATDTALVSLLLSAGLLGGITASPVAPHIMAHFGPIRTISLVFLAQAALIFMASFANNFATDPAPNGYSFLS